MLIFSSYSPSSDLAKRESELIDMTHNRNMFGSISHDVVFEIAHNSKSDKIFVLDYVVWQHKESQKF